MTDLVRFDREGDVAFITLDRQRSLNAINLEMRDAIWDILGVLGIDPTVRCVVVRGAGERALSAGADVTEFGTAPSLIASREARQFRDLWGAMNTLPVPLIAEMHGVAYGSGLELSLHCDLRIAADDTRMALPEVLLGYLPSAGGTQTLPRTVPRSMALQMILTGEPLDARQAFDCGLVHAVVPRTDLEAMVRSWAARIASAPPAAIRAAKRAVIEGIDLRLAEGLALERRLAHAVQAGSG